jgi:ABC-type cobalt transport system substrate-binding protein
MNTKKLLLIVISVFLLVMISLIIFIYQNKYGSSDYVTATGTVIQLTTNPANGPWRLWQAAIEFKTDSGQLVTFTQSLRSGSLKGSFRRPIYPGRGDTVEILYNKNNPSDATIKANWFLWAWFLLAVIVLLVLGFYFSRKWKNYVGAKMKP